MQTQSVRVDRSECLADKVVFVDGIEGCGKTMLAPIVAALDRVELLTYAYEIEYLCSLKHLDKVEDDAASATIALLADLQLYNSMQSREINFRPSDLSSVFRDSRPWRYFRRLFQKGDEAAAGRIAAERPILLLTTHRLTAYSDTIFKGLGQRAVLVETVRHPLYMLMQNVRNFTGLIGTARNFTIYYEYRGRRYPYFALGWEDRYSTPNDVDRAIYYLQHMISRSREMREKHGRQHAGQIVTIPFEKFVVAPDVYMRMLEQALGSTVTRHTQRMMKKQKVPREKYADSIDLAIYRRCGWEPPKAGFSERHEFQYRRDWAARQASQEAMQVLDVLCDEYESVYMDGALRSGGGSYI